MSHLGDGTVLSKVTTNQLLVLRLLWYSPALIYIGTMVQLAEDAGIHRWTAYSTIAALVKRGWVTEGRADRHVYKLQMTTLGRTMYSELRRRLI